MSDVSQEQREEIQEEVLRSARYMQEIKLIDVKGLDLRGRSSITDYYLIATVNSYGQLKGAVKQLHEFFYREGIECRGGKKQSEEDNWVLLDCDDFIIHLMTTEARQFYDLEKLWFESPVLSW
jgi:ribosome-associated protein